MRGFGPWGSAARAGVTPDPVELPRPGERPRLADRRLTGDHQGVPTPERLDAGGPASRPRRPMSCDRAPVTEAEALGSKAWTRRRVRRGSPGSVASRWKRSRGGHPVAVPRCRPALADRLRGHAAGAPHHAGPATVAGDAALVVPALESASGGRGRTICSTLVRPWTDIEDPVDRSWLSSIRSGRPSDGRGTDPKLPCDGVPSPTGPGPPPSWPSSRQLPAADWIRGLHR